jgi:hypothetical protein
VIAAFGLLPGGVDAIVPLALLAVLVARQLRRAAAGPAADPPPARTDRAVLPLAALLAVVVLLELARLL